MYLQKYVATYREKAPHLYKGEKVDFIKNEFVPEKMLLFPRNNKIFCCFSDFVILPVRMYLTACLVFSLLIIILLKLLVLKIYFHSTSGHGQVLFLTLELIGKAKRRKLILDMNLYKAFMFQHALYLKLFFLKSKAQVVTLICYVTENINMRLKKTVKY